MGKEVLNEGFTQVSNKLIKLKGIDCIEKMILINFISYGENIYPSITRICEELNISRPTCVKKINRLKEIGYLKVTKNKSLSGDYDNNSYEVIKKFNYVVKEFNHGSKNNLSQVVKEINSNNTNKTILNNNIYTSSEDEDSISYFERINKEIDDLENEINKELENDLIKKIKSKYSKELIKDELDKLKNKGLSKLDLLIELEKNLKSKKKEIKEECSKDIKTIFDCWNSKGIIKHKTLSPVIKKSIEKVLKDYKLDEIVQAINIYSEILNSQFYFNYKWSLSDFLNRKNGISTFMEEGSNKINYEEWKKGDRKNGNTKGNIIKDRGRFTEGSEDINYKPEEYKGPSYTEEDYKRMYESGELI